MGMDIDGRALEALTSFGLTEYEARVYLALFTKGTQKASVLADVSNIPRPHVYSVIKVLHEKGLIVVIPEKVNKYQAQPIDFVIKKLLEERAESIKSLEAIGKELQTMLQEGSGPADETKTDTVRLYQGRWSVIHLIREMLGRSKISCELISNEPDFVNSTGVYEQELAALKKKDVKVRFLLPITKETLPVIEKLSRLVSIRHLESFYEMEEMLGDIAGCSSLRVLVVDSGEVLFVRSGLDGEEESAIWTSQKELARMITLMFRNMWGSALDVQSKNVEISTGKRQERLTPIYGDVDVEKAIRGIFNRSKSSACCIVSQEQLIYSLNMFVAEIRAMTSRGVNVRILVPLKAESFDNNRTGNKNDVPYAIQAVELSGAEVRHPLQETIMRMVVGDGEVLIDLLGESMVSTSGGMSVYTNHNETVSRIEEHFEGLWESSVDIKTRLKELSEISSRELLKDGEEGLRKYFSRLGELKLGNFAIKSFDPPEKKLVILCTDPREVRSKMRACGDVCESGRDALKAFAHYIYEGTKMECVEVRCVGRGDEYCEYVIYPLITDRDRVGQELIRFFESLKTDKNLKQD